MTARAPPPAPRPSQPSQRPSLGPPPPSLGPSAAMATSSPNLSSTFASSHQRPILPPSQLSARRPSAGSTPKTSFSQQPSKRGLSVQADGPLPEPGSSPLTMYPTRPTNGRTATDNKHANQNFEVGDTVDVPGSMFGTVKFMGEVKGKKGHFAGVELSKEFAARGKNDGDVDGVRYFTTSVRGAGIFLPSNKAYKRLSPTFSSDSMPPTPDTPNLGASYLGPRTKEPKVYTPTSSSNPKFSQSVGPGRVRSPDFKPKSRPSLPRPESPVRKAQNAVSTPSSRPSIGAPKLSKSVIGGARYAPSPMPGKFGGSVRGGIPGELGKKAVNVNKPTPRTPINSGLQPRAGSRLGPEAMFDEDSDNTPVGVGKTIPVQSPQQMSPSKSTQGSEVNRLREMLELRDKQLEKQTLDLEEMSNSLVELQNVMPKHSSGGTQRSRGSETDDMDIVSLRILLREKTESAAASGREFDTHRAQFRDAIDCLERAADETKERYEQREEDLRQDIEQLKLENKDLQDQREQLRTDYRQLQDRDADVESVAQQLKQFEDTIQELDEGLEDARRGEVEARGEVEHLRGMVDRQETELRAEREKAAGAGALREIEQRDDEIRGLKAIIHSLSRDSVSDIGGSKPGSRRISKRHSNQANGNTESIATEDRQAREKLEREVKELEGLVDRKTYREEELEHEIERLRKITAHVSASSNGYSDQTAVPSRILSKSSSTDWRDQTPQAKKHDSYLESMPESDSHSTTMTDNSSLYCEMCETFGHEIFTCPNINGEQPHQDSQHPIASGQAGQDVDHNGLNGLTVKSPHTNDYPPPLSPARSPVATPKVKMLNPMDQGPAAGKSSGAIDMEKWCALCERDGHESVDCPFEDMY